MKKAATVSLSKYNVPIKAREKVTTVSTTTTGFKTENRMQKSLDGHWIVSRSASDKDVLGVARNVIVKHHDVIKRLAKR
ncbi:hypothetical protein [Cupriavidus sp. DL-D2]|uniref:hypothetical protein n=1 Tax=Cupriavidus sp. DL-D2 TaxID=3144974 RepID=UPI0032123A44